MSSRYDEFLRYQNLVPYLAEAVRQAEEGDFPPLISLILKLLGLTADEAVALYPELRPFLDPGRATVSPDD